MKKKKKTKAKNRRSNVWGGRVSSISIAHAPPTILSDTTMKFYVEFHQRLLAPMH